jgi:hypothetical protein
MTQPPNTVSNRYQTISYPQWSENELDHLASFPYTNQFIDLSLCGKKINDAALKKLAMNAPELRYINITKCREITSKGLEDLIYFCTELETIQMDTTNTLISKTTIEKTKKCLPNMIINPWKIFDRRWDLIQAIQSGPFGKEIATHILTTFPQELSATTVEAALKILSQNNDKHTARKVTDIQRQFYPILTPPDKLDLHILLFASTDPQSYAPLGKIPEEQGWVPLTQAELERMSAGQGIPTRANPILFENLKHVDDVKTDLSLDEIRKTETTLFTKLYRLIKANRINLRISGRKKFRDEVLNHIVKILQAPSGRWLILFVCRAKKRTNIIEANDKINCFYQRKKIDRVYLTSTTPSLVAQNADHLFIHKFGQDSTLFHELLHKWQEDQNLLQYLRKFRPINKQYTNLAEQFVIAGVDNLFLSLAPFIFQNRYHFERNYVARFGHCDAYYLKENPEPKKTLATLIAEENLSNLKQLFHWRVPKDISLGNFSKIAIRAPLISLDFSYNPKVKDIWLSSLGHLCKELSQLNLEGCSITDEDLSKIDVPDLKVLNLANCSQISTIGVNQLSQRCRALELILKSPSESGIQTRKRKIDLVQDNGLNNFIV